MTLFPDSSTALVIGLFLLATSFVIVVSLLWFTLPKRIDRTINERMKEAQKNLMGEVKTDHTDNYMEALEDELHHQRRRNTGKHKRKQ